MRLFSIVYRGAPTILALASIVIAVLVAYMQIEQKEFLQKIEQKSHQTDRTISIMNAFYSSPSYQNLSRLGDAIVYEQHRRLLSNEDRNTSKEVYLELTKGKRKEVGPWLVHFIRTLDTIYYCGRRSQEASRIPCDRLLLIQVYFEELAWMFFQVRYGIYCDPVIKEIFAHHGFDDEAGSAIYRLETMLLEYLEHEAHGRRHPEVDYKPYIARKQKDDEHATSTEHVLRPNLATFCHTPLNPGARPLHDPDQYQNYPRLERGS